MELLRWSSKARWCTWHAIGIHDFSIIDDVATGICVSLPILTFLLVLGQLVALTAAYRSDIAALRRGEPVFTKKQREASEISTGSEWLGYQLVTSGITYFVVIVVLGVISFGLAIPIIALATVNDSLRGRVLGAVFVVVVAWISGIILGVVYRRLHIKIFTEPRLNVLRYVHWFQFSDYLMLYITMQRSFFVVLIRIGVSIVLQAACIMRSDMTFFPLMVGKRVDKPHMAYVSVVLNDRKYSCPIVFSFYEVLRDAGRANGRARLAREARAKGKKLTGGDSVRGEAEGKIENAPSDDPDAKSPSRCGKSPSLTLPTIARSNVRFTSNGKSNGKSSRVASLGRSVKNAMVKRLKFYDLFSGADGSAGKNLSDAAREALAFDIDALRRRRRARTRWFLAITLMNNPGLISMRAPWGGKPENLTMLKPVHLPHNIKEGWLRRRGGILGVVNNDYVVLTPGVLFIFEHATAHRVPPAAVDPPHLRQRGTSPAEEMRRAAPSDAELGSAGRSRAQKEEARRRKEVEKTRKDTGGDGRGVRSPSFMASEDAVGSPGAKTDANGDAKEKEKTWRIREKYFFVVFVPGGPIQVFGSDDLEEVVDWVNVLRASCVNTTERRMLDALKED